MDNHFAVTGHWIENSPRVWECKSALFRFTNTHNSKCLGRALFKVSDCVSTAHKVCSVLFS
jgi:hypothetical protein